jgi:hypothetical protein
LQFPVFFDNVIALIRNSSGDGGITTVHLSDGRVKFLEFTPVTLRKRYYTLLDNERGS